MQREVRGRRIGFDDRGSGEVVVLLHAFPFHRLLWAGLAEALAARRRVLAVDARGFGESPLDGGGRGDDESFQITDLADDVAGLLDALSIARATVVGMSMGGYTALALAARHPGRLHGLVLADTRAAADTPEIRQKRDEGIALCGRDGDGGEGALAYLLGSLPRLLSAQAPPALAAHIRARAERRPASLIAGLRAMRDRPDRTGELSAIACPTLVLGGGGEQVVPPAEMRAMSAAIPGARYEEIPGAGHLAHLEAPGRFEIALGAFLDELPGGGAMKLVTTLFERVHAAAAAAAQHLAADEADAAVVLGSGLGGVADTLEDARSAPYASLPGFPETTVAGHPGRMVSGVLAGRKVLLLCGRTHGYEGYPAHEVGFGVRVVAALGARTLIVTNAAGAVDPALGTGEIVAISDHINLTGASPLTGPNDERLGPRFVDMTDAYAPSLRALAAAASQKVLKRPLAEAIYAGMGGPAYETPAEVRLLRTLGAGLVGMSTVHEVITARHAGLDVLGLSLVANPAAGVTGARLRHEDVTRAAAAGADAIGRLISAVVGALPAT